MYPSNSKFSQRSTWSGLLFGASLLALSVESCSVDKGKYTFIPDDQFADVGVSGNASGGDTSGGGQDALGGSGHGGGVAHAGADASGGMSSAGDTSQSGAPDSGCQVGEHACSADGHLQTCKAGDPPAFDNGIDCGDPARCSASLGVCLKCTPGQFQCANAVLQQCNIFGSGFEDTAVCDNKLACIANDQKGYCVRCKPAAATCEDTLVREQTSNSDSAVYAANRLLTCNAEGSGQETSAVCEADQEVCNATGKTCQRCEPNAYFCDGAQLNKCTADGNNYDFKASCTSAALCDAVNGKCLTGDCTPGQFNCVGATLQSCGRDGKWATLDTCPSAAACDSSYGRCQACSTSSTTCANNAVQNCDYNQGQYKPYAYQSCVAGTCTVSGNYANCGQCKPGTISCYAGSTSYYACGASSSTYCGTGQVCNPQAVTDSSAPKCVSCAPGSYACDNNNVLKVCASDGSGFSVQENCQLTNKYCDAGRGMCLPANPGSFYCADNGDLVQVTYDANHQVVIDNDKNKVQSCGTKNLCDQYSGSCRKGQCVVGEKTCSGADVYSCDTGDYRRRTSTRCATTTRCQDGYGCVKTLAIAAGDAHTCAIVAASDANFGAAGYMLCWGANESGQLGNGSPLLSDSKEARQVVVSDTNNGVIVPGPHVLAPYFADLCAGKNFTCGLIQMTSDSDKKSFVACWGSNRSGQLGVNLADPGPYNAPFEAVTDGATNQENGLSLESVSCGAEFACALGADGTAYCWGENDAGQLGNGSVGTPSPAATPVDGHQFTQLSAGAHHVCGVQADSSVWCWGAGSDGQLGFGTNKGSATPKQVGKLIAVSDRPLALGNDFSLVLAPRAAKSPYAWGANRFGQLGTGTNDASLEPVALSGLLTSDIGTAGTIYSGSTAEHACVRIGDTLQCWGANVFGQLGNGTTDDSSSPVAVLDGKTDATKLAPGARSVAVGGRHTCAITAKGDVMCWGANHRYQLGSGVLTPQRTPIRGY